MPAAEDEATKAAEEDQEPKLASDSDAAEMAIHAVATSDGQFPEATGLASAAAGAGASGDAATKTDEPRYEKPTDEEPIE